MTDLSLNIRSQHVNTNTAAAALKTLGSTWALVESNPGQARELAAQGWRVVYRDYWPGPDDNLHDRVTPLQWVAHMMSLDLPPEIYWYCVNEPSHDYEPLQAWLLDAMQLARSQGRRLVVANFSTGLPATEDWRDLFGPLLEALADGWHVLGAHEYLVQAYEVSIPWHVGRFQFALDACKQAGIKPPRIMITEAGFDLSGSWKSMGLSAEAFAAEVGRAMREKWRPGGIEAVFIFSLGSWQNGQGWEFDVTDALGELAKIGQEGEPMDMDTRERGFVKPAGQYANIRASANGQDVGDLVGSHATQRTVETVSAAGLVWRHYAFEDGTVSGWIADSAVGWDAVAVVPEPEPTPDSEPTPEPAPLPADALTEVYRRLIANLELYRNMAQEMARQANAAASQTQEQIDDARAVLDALVQP